MWFSRNPKPEDETVLPPYDFSVALLLPVMERFERSVAILQERARAEAAIYGESLAPLQPGFSEYEITDLERKQGAPFASEVREFLRQWKRVGGGGGFGFHGPDSWVTDEKFAGKRYPDSSYLVVGDYWRYADGDLLIMPLTGETGKVLLYLHEDGPEIEEIAPSFSLALWRMAHEDFEED